MFSSLHPIFYILNLSQVLICLPCCIHSISASRPLYLNVRNTIKGHLAIGKHCPSTWLGLLLTTTPGFQIACSSSKEDRHHLVMLLHNEMRVFHACLLGYFRERCVGMPSWQIFLDFINELCTWPQGTKGQKILCVNLTSQGKRIKKAYVIKKAVVLTLPTTPRDFNQFCPFCIFNYKRGPYVLMDCYR